MEHHEQAIAGLQLASARLAMILVLLLAPFQGFFFGQNNYNCLLESDLCDIIDPRSANMYSLARLPGIGPSKAQRIVDYRLKHPIKSIDDLDAITGFGPKTMEKIHNYLYFKELP